MWLWGGGDGTLHNVVNGIMIHGKNFLQDICLGVIPVGTGNDWAKHYSIPTDINKNIEILNKGNTIYQDIGKLTHKGKVSYFNNIAGLGFDGFVANQVNQFKKFGEASYFLASLKSLILFSKPTLTYSWNNSTKNSKCYILLVGICSFCGGGMRLTHQPNPTDGLLDVTVVKDISKLGFIWNIRKMFNGKLHQHPKVETFKTNKLTVGYNGKITPLIQADGESVGEGEIKIEILEKVMKFVVS